MWWAWEDPALDGPESDPRPMLIPMGVVFNPLIIGIPAWLVLCVPPVLVRAAIRVVRGQRGVCAWCGYEVQSLEICPECGAGMSIGEGSSDSA